ncbi:nucleoid-associated protein YgaU [Variovorax paradoxus]|nr:nucleoid-associated protein YgaU [Variovorax paradoxus]
MNDANGNALYAYYAYEGTPQVHANGQRQLVVNGEVLGRYGLLADTRFEGTALAQNGPLFSAQSDFSFGYQPIDGNYPAGSPGTYAVATGDTLQSIAKGAYGDASLWYLIADANGLSSDADLRTGQVLRIPTRVGSADNASTFRPYDPSKIASDSPTMMATPQAEDGGCGAVGQIIMVVVAVVAAVFTAGAALAAMGATLATAGTGTLIAAGAIGGAVGSIASQAVGIAIGAQDSFSWKGVALGAIGGGVTAGLGGAGLLPDTGNVFLDGAIRGAVSSTLTQGIAVVTGLQDKFSWKSVAASAVGAGVGAAAGPAIGKAFGEAFGNNAGSAFAARLATGLVAGTAAAVMRGGKVAIQQVATDAFGNALGESIAAANGQQAQGVGPRITATGWTSRATTPRCSGRRSLTTTKSWGHSVSPVTATGTLACRSQRVRATAAWVRAAAVIRTSIACSIWLIDPSRVERGAAWVPMACRVWASVCLGRPRAFAATGAASSMKSGVRRKGRSIRGARSARHCHRHRTSGYPTRWSTEELSLGIGQTASTQETIRRASWRGPRTVRRCNSGRRTTTAMVPTR